MLRYLDSRKRKAEDDEGAGEGPSAPRPDPIHPERVSEVRKPVDPMQQARMESAAAVNLKVFGNASFRPRQAEIVDAILDNRDVFVVMPTGGGKSLCFQCPAVMSKGLTVVISPLLSLIEDQVSTLVQLPTCGGIPAAYLSSACAPGVETAIFDDLERADRGLEPFLKLLYVTPERIAKSDRTRDRLLRLYHNEMLARFVIDEAHCVSTWGHDFRKDYKEMSILKQCFPETPVVALTATARSAVQEDTMRILGIRDSAVVFSAGFDRPNLLFGVRPKPASSADSMKEILKYIVSNGRAEQTGIVYCMSKADAENLAYFLRDNKLSADFYHAGQTPQMRKLVQGAWSRGDTKIVCATIAYGMGIDKPDVRYVLHLSLAKSLEGYYQEAGRAGRDGLRSECIIFYRPADVRLLARLLSKPPARRLSQKDKERLEEMEEYCRETQSCRRRLFAQCFGDMKVFKACGNMCDNCLGTSGLDEGEVPSKAPRRKAASAVSKEAEAAASPVDATPSESSSKNKSAAARSTKFVTAGGREISTSKSLMKPTMAKASAPSLYVPSYAAPANNNAGTSNHATRYGRVAAVPLVSEMHAGSEEEEADFYDDVDTLPVARHHKTSTKSTVISLDCDEE